MVRIAWNTWACVAVGGLCMLVMACGEDSSGSTGALRPTAFRDAVATRDLDALLATLADDVELYSPVLIEPFVGYTRVSRLFGVLVDVFEEIEITDDYEAEGRYALSFTARVGSEDIRIVDLLRFDDEGKIKEIIVTARPLAGIQALAAAVAPHLPEINQ
jgi:hypothetical protein